MKVNLHRVEQPRWLYGIKALHVIDSGAAHRESPKSREKYHNQG